MYLEMADNCEELEKLKTQLRFAQKRIEELEATGIVILLDIYIYLFIFLQEVYIPVEQ